MPVAQWSRRLQQGVLTSVFSALSLGLVFTSPTQAQSGSFTEECNYLVATAEQNLLAFSTLESNPFDTFVNAVSQGATLVEVQAAAEQYSIAVDELLNNINELRLEFQGAALSDPGLEGYRTDYVAVLSGLINALNVEQAAVTAVAATETEAELPQN